MHLRRYVTRRLLFFPLALLVVVTASFILVNVLPGNPASRLAGPAATPEIIAQIEERLGLDRPAAERYLAYIGDLFEADLGRSFFTNQPILEEVGRRLPDTLELVIPSLVLASALGLVLGTLSAYLAGRAADRISRAIVAILQSLPDFFLGLLLIYLIFFVLGWAPAPVGRLGFADTPPNHITGALLVDTILTGQWKTLGSTLSHMVLPVLALGLYNAAFFAKITQATMRTALLSKQVEFARACGMPERKVLGYALREARTPILTYGSILLASLLGGAAIVEKVFAWGGFGEWAIDSILDLDIPAVQGFVLVTGIMTLLIFIALDVIVALLDPRIQYE